jgi:phosphoenolpyruvate---glycerone phosphotransferase subunit DhaL
MSISTVEIKYYIKKLCEVIIENEVYFCELDSAAGDGDFGMSLAKGFKEILKEIDEIDDTSPEKFVRECSNIITEFCGGASGPIWGFGFRGAALSIKGKETIDLSDIANMFLEAIVSIQKRGGAKLGDKTLLDALIPAAKSLEECALNGKTIKEAFTTAANSAYEGAEATKALVASKGRATYVGERSLGHPDAGAVAISVILKSFVN